MLYHHNFLCSYWIHGLCLDKIQSKSSVPNILSCQVSLQNQRSISCTNIIQLVLHTYETYFCKSLFLMETTIFDLKPDSLQTLICTFLCLAPQMTSHTKLIHSYWTTMPILILLSFLCFCLLIAMHWHPFLIFAFYNISGMTLKIISNPSHLLSFLCFCLLTAMHWHPFFLFFLSSFAFHNIYGMTLKIIHTQYLACSNWFLTSLNIQGRP